MERSLKKELLQYFAAKGNRTEHEERLYKRMQTEVTYTTLRAWKNKTSRNAVTTRRNSTRPTWSASPTKCATTILTPPRSARTYAPPLTPAVLK